MSIKDLFNSKGTPKIQKSVTSDELVENIESEDFVESKRKQFGQFIPPINFTTASNFAKFGSAELYYEKAFERIHNYYPYDGTLAEKIEFENSSSFLDKHVFDNIYPRTNGYLKFNGSIYVTAFGGPHTASGGMTGKKFSDTFDNSSVYDEETKRTNAFEFKGNDGITVEFWLQVATASTMTIMHVSGGAKAGDIKLRLRPNDSIQLLVNSGSLSGINETLIEDATAGGNWNHFAFSMQSSSNGLTFKSYKNGDIVRTIKGTTSGYNVPQIVPAEAGLNLTLGANEDATNKLSGSMDEFRYWKKTRTHEEIRNTWFIPVGGGTNKHDSNVDLGCYFKFNEGITGNDTLDSTVLDYSGRFHNGKIIGYTSGVRSTNSAITQKLSIDEFKDPIIYSSHPDVSAKKTEYKTSGSLADLENSSMLYRYFPAWMQEEDEQNGKQLKHLSQVLGSYFDTLWHQIDFVNKIHDNHYISGSKKALPFSKNLLYNAGFVVPDLFVDATVIENLRQKDDTRIFEKEINEVRNTIYHNLYNNLQGIYKSKGTEKSFRNFFRSIGIGQDVVKMRMYADDSTFVLRNNYEHKSFERKFLNFNKSSHFDASVYLSSSNTNMPGDGYISGDSQFLGSFSAQTEFVLPRKQRKNEVNYDPFPYLTSSIMGYREGSSYSTAVDGLQIYAVHSVLENNLDPNDKQRVKFVLTGSGINLHTDWYWNQYENNKWSLAVRMKHATYPHVNISGSDNDDYLLEFYGVEADGNTKRNYFHLSASSLERSYYSSDKIFYAGANRTKFTGSTLYHSDIKLGYVRYWHSYLSNDAVDQHAFDSETFGTNEPFEQDLINTYPCEIPREKTLSLHWAFNNLSSSNQSGEFTVPDLSSGSISRDYSTLSPIIQNYHPAKGIGFDASSSNFLDKIYLYSAKKRLPDDLMSSDLTTIKTDETEQFFVDENVSDNFYSFEKSLWGTISEEMMNMFATALDLNNLIGQPNQRYQSRYIMADFLRDRFFDDVENEPDLERFTSFYKWIDDSISIALRQLVPASARFSEKINNVIESHVLERNKYIHQIPILSTFESTEGSIKGHAELNYNWRFGHAPTDTSDESRNTLWHKERSEKSGLRETIRNSRNNHSIQSSGLLRVEIDGTARISDVYATRRFAKTYDVSLVSQPTIHGGTNFGRKKNLHLFHESIAPLGAIGATSSVPQNIITVGVGAGTSGLVDSTTGRYDKDNPPAKRKVHVNAQIGNRAGNEYGHDILGDFVLPMNVMSGAVRSGFNKAVSDLYVDDLYFTNIHHDSVGNYNETSMQGPFTEQHVGGLQYRHVDLNGYNSEDGAIDQPQTRPEGWALLITEHPVSDPTDSAFGFVGADYESPYPSLTLKKATRYRDEHAKRPINIRNIKTVSGSWKAGNYKSELEIFQVSPTFQKTWAIEAYNDPNTEILPGYISQSLPLTTHYQTLMGITPQISGNVFGQHTNNRQPDGGLFSEEIVGQTATGRFSVTGATNSGTFARGSFHVTGSPSYSFASGSFEVTGATLGASFASGSFEITGANIQGTQGIGEFTMTQSFVPSLTASYSFAVEGRTVLGSLASASFSVSGTVFEALPATASFTVGSNPVGGRRAYAIFDASYQAATDGHTFRLGRSGDTDNIEVDLDGAVTASGNTSVSPITIEKAMKASGSTVYFEGPVSINNSENLCMSMWVKINDAAIASTPSNSSKYLYQSFNAGKPHVEIFFQSGSNNTNLVARHYITNNGSNLGKYKQFTYPSFGGDSDWRHLFFFFHDGEFKLYENGSLDSTQEIYLGEIGTGTTDFGGVTPVSHSVMGASTNHGWSDEAYISDLIIWDNFDSTNHANFVPPVYNNGNFSQTVISGSDVVARYTFGDDPGDGFDRNELVIDTTNSGSDLTVTDRSELVNSLFARVKTPTQYFESIKTALETHNSDGTYYDVDFVEYQESLLDNITASYNFDATEGFKYGDPTYEKVIAAGTAVDYATFFVVQKAESSANSISPHIDADYGSGSQEASFRNLTSSNTGFGQIGIERSIEDSTFTIDSNVFRFNDHNNSQTGNVINTFTTTGSCVSGSSSGIASNFSNSSYPSKSTLNGGSEISVSFWHARQVGDTSENQILQLDATTGNASAGALSIISHQNYIAISVYQNASTVKSASKTWSNIGINEHDLNHFVWTFNPSSMSFTLWVNGELQSSVTTTGTAASFSHAFNGIYVAGRDGDTTRELRGRLTQLSIWDSVLYSTPIREIYNNARKKDLYGVSGSVKNLVHWYKMNEDDIIQNPNLRYQNTFEDFTPRKLQVDLTVVNGDAFTPAPGLPTDTLSSNDFWNNISSSIKANSGFDSSRSSGVFTISSSATGESQNGTSLSEDSLLVSSMDSVTGGGRDASGAVVGHSITIDTKTFNVDTDGTNSDTSTDLYVQFTGSNADIWNYLSQSIKDNSVFGTISITDNGDDTATFHLTSSVTGSDKNVSMSKSGASFSLIQTASGGITHEGPFDGDYVQLRPTTTATDDRYFVADTNADGVDDTPTGYRYVNSLQSSNAAWWNALSSSIKAAGFEVSYVSDTPSVGQATFTVESNVYGAAGNNGQNTQFNGSSFFNVGAVKFASGADEFGAVLGDEITVGGTTLEVIHSGTPSATQILATGSGVTSDSMWYSVIQKIEAGGLFTVVTSSVSESCTFTVTSVATGSGTNPSISSSGSTFVVTNSGTTGDEERGAEAGDTITIQGETFTIVSGVPSTNNEISYTGSTSQFHNALTASIAAATDFDNITVSDLGNGYFKFSLTSSVDGDDKNVAFTSNSQGVRTTFQNLLGANGGELARGAEANDNIQIGATTLTIKNAPPSNAFEVCSTGSTTEFHGLLSQSIKDNTDFDTVNISDLGNGYFKFSLTSSVSSSAETSISFNSQGSRTTFQNGVDAKGGGRLLGGIDEGAFIELDGKRYIFTTASVSDTETEKYIMTTGSSAQIWGTLENRIEENHSLDITVTDNTTYALFQLTASVTGSAFNFTLSESGDAFSNLSNLVGGNNENGIDDGDRISFAGFTFHLTASSVADSSPNFYVDTSGLSSSQIWSALKTKIESATADYTVVTSSFANHAVFELTASNTGSQFNSTITENFGARTFFSLSGIDGGVSFSAAMVGVDNVIEIPRTDLTGSKRNIVTRFSAPGGIEVQTIGYLDAYTQTYSVHNALPFRNLPVLLDSGENNTIRVEDHLGLRRGLNTLRALHMGKFGLDSQYGTVLSEDYSTSGSFNKQHRNRSRRMEYSGASIITGSNYDNAFINTPIPRSELQYSWINSSTSGSDAPIQRILGYAPRDGFVSSSEGYFEALIFPSASTIYGSL